MCSHNVSLSCGYNLLMSSCRGRAIANVERTCGPTPLHTSICKCYNKICLYFLLFLLYFLLNIESSLKRPFSMTRLAFYGRHKWVISISSSQVVTKHPLYKQIRLNIIFARISNIYILLYLMVFFKWILKRLRITMTHLALCITPFRSASSQNFDGTYIGQNSVHLAVFQCRENMVMKTYHNQSTESTESQRSAIRGDDGEGLG